MTTQHSQLGKLVAEEVGLLEDELAQGKHAALEKYEAAEAALEKSEGVKIDPDADLDVLPHIPDPRLIEIDDMDETSKQRIKEALKVYIGAVVAVKERRDKESSLAAAKARLHLQSLVFKNQSYQS